MGNQALAINFLSCFNYKPSYAAIEKSANFWMKYALHAIVIYQHVLPHLRKLSPLQPSTLQSEILKIAPVV